MNAAVIEPRDVRPPYVRQVVAEAGSVELVPVALRGRLAADAVPVLSVVRNEAAVLGDFLAHYRRLGADRFVMLDNGSDDGTAERLAAEPDVDLYRVDRPFRWQAKQGWIMQAIARIGFDRWYVQVDADEHLVFAGPGSMRDLIGLAAARGLRRLRGMLVDMYGAGPVFAPSPGAGAAPLAARFPLYDRDTYAESLRKQMVSRRGGPRRRMIGDGSFDPELSKYPVFHIRCGEVTANPHHLYPYSDNFASPCVAALLHYKFTERFPAKIADAVTRRCYFNDSAEYRAYQAALLGSDGRSLAFPGSATYSGPEDLVAAGLIEPLVPARSGLGLRRIGWRWLRLAAAGSAMGARG
jgi:hypothetical protein